MTEEKQKFKLELDMSDIWMIYRIFDEIDNFYNRYKNGHVTFDEFAHAIQQLNIRFKAFIKDKTLSK